MSMPGHPQRPDQHEHVDVEGDQLADGEVAVEHLVAAVPEHGDQAEGGQEVEDGHEAGPDARRAHGPVVDAARCARRMRSAWMGSAPKPLTTRMPVTVSSTTVATPASSCCSSSDDGVDARREALGRHVDERQGAEGEQGQARRW